MKKILFSLIALFAIMTFLPAQAAIKVSPTLIELDANKAKGNYLTTSFDIEGGKKETIRFKVYPQFFNITTDGRMEVLDNVEVTNSLLENIRFVPSEFTLANGQKQKVRVMFNNINKLPEGESRIALFLEDVVAKEVILPSNNGVSPKIVVKSRIGIPIYIDKGKYVKTGQFDDLQVQNKENNLTYSIKLSSLGNSKIRYKGKGQIIKNNDLVEEFTIPSNAVGAKSSFDNSFNYVASQLKEDGEYTLRLILEYRNEKNETKKMVKEANFSAENLPKGTTTSQERM